MISVPLDRLMTAAAALMQTTAQDLRLGWDDRALSALGAFAWLAGRCTRATPSEAARHAGRPLSLLLDVLAQFESHLAAHPEEGERMAVEAHALVASATIERRRGRIVDDVPPAEIARRLVLNGPSALTVGRAQLAALGAPYLSLVQTQEA